MAQITTILFCFNYLSAYTIEIIILIVSFLGLGNLYFSHVFMPWFADSDFEETLFISIGLLFFSIIITFCIIILILRIKKTLNIKYNGIGFYLSIVSIFTSLFGLITSFIIYIFVLTNMSFYNSSLSERTDNNNLREINGKDWIFTLISIILSIFVWIVLILSTMSDNLRIDLKINESYKQYLQAILIEEIAGKNKNETTYSVRVNGNDKNDIIKQQNIEYRKTDNSSSERNMKNENNNENNENNENNNEKINENKIINGIVNDKNINKLDQVLVEKTVGIFDSTKVIKENKEIKN